MKAWRRGIACVTAVAMLVCGMSFVETQAASTIKLSTSKVTLTVGKTTRIRVKNYKKKVIWSSAKKSVAAVTSVGKYVGRVKAKKAGSTKCFLLFYRYTLKIQNPEKFRISEISSQVSAIAAYRFSQIKALTGVLDPCFALLSVKFALQTFTLLF